MKRRKRAKNGPGFFKLVSDLSAQEAPKASSPIKAEVIRVENPEIVHGPIPETRELSVPQQPSGMITGSLLDSPDHVYAVKSTGAHYNDQRYWGVKRDGQGWRLEAHWSARGTGQIPMGLLMMTKMQSMFNGIFNMIVGSPMVDQEVVSHSSPGMTSQNPLLSFLGEDDDEDRGA